MNSYRLNTQQEFTLYTARYIHMIYTRSYCHIYMPNTHNTLHQLNTNPDPIETESHVLAIRPRGLVSKTKTQQKSAIAGNF